MKRQLLLRLERETRTLQEELHKLNPMRALNGGTVPLDSLRERVDILVALVDLLKKEA